MDVRQHLSSDLLGADYAALTPQRRAVIDLIADQRPTEFRDMLPDERNHWERLADRVAAIGGSWGFILTFGAVLATWIGMNLALQTFGEAFDPYPFIFLNLMLSMIAAVQAPIIMMSQNRQAAKDRISAEHDYMINLRAELEIMLLHDKLDALRDNDLKGRMDGLAGDLAAIRADLAAMRQASARA